MPPGLRAFHLEAGACTAGATCVAVAVGTEPSAGEVASVVVGAEETAAGAAAAADAAAGAAAAAAA